MEIFLLFMLYSFLGCAAEDAYYYMLHARYVSKRTMLNLPLCPVYGIAGVLMGYVNSGISEPVLLFCGGFLSISAVELIFYLVSRRRYGIKWWDYSDAKINLMGGVSLFYSVMWGGVNILFARFDPVCRGWIHSLPDGAKMLTGLFLLTYFTADLKATAYELKKYKNGEENQILSRFRYIKTDN